MRVIACCIDASLQDSPFPFGVSRPPKSVRDWSGILCELFGSGLWGRERDFRAGTGFGSGNGIWERERDLGAGGSEQRYSGKPDGVAGTPKSINKQKKSPSLTTLLSEWPDSNGRPLAPHARMLANCTTPR